MEQMTLFDMTPPYRYIIDSSSIFSQKDNEAHPRILYPTKWSKIDELIANREIVTCTEIVDEIKDDYILEWLVTTGCKVLSIDGEIQTNVKEILNKHPKLLDFNKLKSSADAFLIATAIKYKLTIITEESKQSFKKIPCICKSYGTQCVNITELCLLKGWSF